MLKSIRFIRYKAFEDYTINFQGFNILVGPNNCGKSTVIGSLRLLDIAFRKARSTRAISYILKDGVSKTGYLLNTSAIDVSTENVAFNYSHEEPLIIYIFSDGKRCEIVFAEDGDCYFSCYDNGVIITSPKAFLQSFSDTIKCVPILGPLEHNEEFVTKATVSSNIYTHRASRNFRNYWYHFPKDWDKFSKLINDTWPGMEVEKPYLNGKNIFLMCKENRIARELFWVGYGFQIWCQILTHLSMLGESTIFVIDEPEIYLHAEVQRQLITLLREIDKQVIIATHSIEILGETNPDDVVIIEKEKEHSYRIKNIDGIQRAVTLIGSIHNITLANLARTRKMLCVENLYDYGIISKFMKIIKGYALERSGKITPIQIEGSSFVQNVKSFAWGLKEKFSLNIDIGLIIDRDFYSKESIQDVYNNLEKEIDYIHILEMKEIENYLLDFKAMSKCIKAFSPNADGKIEVQIEKEIIDIFIDVTNQMKNYVFSQISANRLKTKAKQIDDSSEIMETLNELEDKWKQIDSRKRIIPGKKVMQSMREELQKRYRTNISDSRILNYMTATDIDEDMIRIIDELTSFIV